MSSAAKWSPRRSRARCVATRFGSAGDRDMIAALGAALCD